MKPQPPVDPTPFRQRRNTVAQRMGPGIAIIPTAPERPRSRDTHHPYRPDSNFWYLSGFAEPDAVLVIDVTGDIEEHVLFCREKDLEHEIWQGFRYGPDAAREVFGFDVALPIARLDEELARRLAKHCTVTFPFGASTDWDSRLASWLRAVRAQARSGARPPERIADLAALLDPMRLIKDADEIRCLKRAADIATVAHERAMRFARPGLYEHEIEAEFLHEFRRNGADGPSYTTIVASGANACCLHYQANHSPLEDGDLLLIDAGAEWAGYASDITRSFPVNGRFSGPQRDVYAIVLAAQQAAINAVQPGRGFDAPHEAALGILCQGLIDLGILTGTVEDALATEAYKPYYMHRTSHWLGLDVHDAGAYRERRTVEQPDPPATPLAPNMALTIEPGLYFRPNDAVPEALHGIGIRIEDDVLVTTSGAEVLTSPAKTIADIEQLMAER